MARRQITIDEKIEKQKEVVLKIKDRYEAALNDLKTLMKKKHDLESKELINAFEKSDKSLDEILDFLSSKA
ncbi:hypothetical protein EZV73_27615 [Acidaminobacter sp. JC074]|uniref:hypothetical protein n=1 Tax=Acidaminobacter sp. JC074 TaxID=2530199 RepID=UPI001F114A6B|nr:hypothetical protein [Acidaminobacter sp. JC074]MCH4891370.1 hypothetical protein [Acidaminobacter sp. JC074]